MKLFTTLMLKLGPCNVDLFAARHKAQLKRFYTYRPDPAAEATDAPTQSWKQLTPYAFPPFVLISRVLQKIRQEAVYQAILIAPLWRSTPWFPVLLERLMDYPVLLPRHFWGELHPLIGQNSLQLVAWKGSGRESTVKIFQMKLSNFWSKGTEKSYTTAWNHWSSWYTQWEVTPTLSQILEFMRNLSLGNSIPQSIHTGLLSLVPIDGFPVGQHPLVCKLLQGVFNKRPPAPRYTSMWNSSVPYTALSLKELSKNRPCC